MLLLSFLFADAQAGWMKALCVAGMAAYLVNLAVIPGRSGHLAFIVLSPVMLYQMLGKKRLIWIAVGAVALMALLFSSSTVRDRAALAVDEVRAYYDEGKVDTSVGMRLHMYDGAWRIFMEHPVIGAGTGGYEIEMDKRAASSNLPSFAHPHNSFLYMAASYGVVGLGVFVWMLAVFIRSAWRARKSLGGFAALAFALVLLVGSITDTQFLTLGTGTLFAMFVGMDRSYAGGDEQAEPQ
jgi:O-antigen ligase